MTQVYARQRPLTLGDSERWDMQDRAQAIERRQTIKATLQSNQITVAELLQQAGV